MELKPIFETVDQLYKKLFYDYFDKLHSYAFTIVKNSDEAKDIVQKAFLNLWQKRSDVELEASGKPYLYRSVYNLSINSIRDKKTRAKHCNMVPFNDRDEQSYSVEQKEIQIQIIEAVEKLPEKCRQVFYKSRFEGKKYHEISSEMNISIRTVEVQIARALKFLRQKLAHLTLVTILIYSIVK